MDFLALPRRDLQALCKRNGVRANMTNAAMAEALAALPAVDGIGEYVKEPVALPAADVKAAAADEQQREKQGSPLPRGRRVTVKAVETDSGKEDEKRDRRGPSRRARAAPAVATSMVLPDGKGEEGEDKPDGCKEERWEVNKEDPPAPVVGRRAPPELAAESADAGAVEEQRKKDGSPAPRGRRGAVKSSEPIRPDDCEDEKELKRGAGTDGAPALGVGRRGASRRTRPAPALAEPAGKVLEEKEEAPPLPRGRHVKAKSTLVIKLNDDKEDKKAAMEPEEEEDVPALGVGRRGASRRVRRLPAVAAVAGKVAAEDEPRALIPHGHRVEIKSLEVISLDDSEDEEKEDTKLDEKDDEVPAIGEGRRGANRRAPAPVEAPATRTRAATSKVEAVGLTVEVVPTRATRQRKPTMKAVAAAVEKALPKATRRKAVKKTVSQQEEQENPQEVVAAPVSDVGCDIPQDPQEASGPQNREQKQKDEDVVIIEDKILMQETLAQELLGTDQESMDHLTVQGQQVGAEKCPAPLASHEDLPIMGLLSMATEHAADKDEGANFQDGEGSNGSLDKGVFEDILDADEEMEMVTEEHIEEVVTDYANHESEIGNFNEVPHGTEETCEANTEDDLVSQNTEDINNDELQADLADGSVLVDCSGIIKQFVEEETNEVNTEDGVPLQEKGGVLVDMALPDTVAEAIPSGCSSVISCLDIEKSGDITSKMSESPATMDEVGEETNSTDICHADKPREVVIGGIVSQVNTADKPRDVPVDMALPEIVAEAIPSGCSSDVSCVGIEKSGDITSKMSESAATLDEEVGGETNSLADICHADKPREVIIGDSVSQVTVTDSEVVQEEKVVVITDEMPSSTAVIHDDQVVAADILPEVKMIDCEVEEEKTAMDEDVVNNHFETDVVHADEQKEVVTIDEVPECTRTDGVLLEEDKAAVISEEAAHGTGAMDDCVQQTYFEIGFVQDDELNNAVTADNVPEITEIDGAAKNTFVCGLPRELDVAKESNDQITQALLGNVTESLCKSIITVEPTVSVSDGITMCNNNSEKNTTELEATQEEKGVKEAKKSMDLKKLSIRQLRFKLKEKLNAKKNKEAKRVALARVDENVCRSHSKGQHKNLNLQQH